MLTKYSKSFFSFLLHPSIFFWLAVLTIVGSGRYLPLLDQALDPSGFVIGAIMGVVLYYQAIVMVSRGIPHIPRYIKEVGRALGRDRPPARKMIILAGRAVYEEAFWRGTVQILLGMSVPAVLLTALLFTGRHIYLYHRTRRLPLFLIIEFFTFSLGLGVLYLLTDRIMLLVGAHFIRNALITARCTVPARQTTTISSAKVLS